MKPKLPDMISKIQELIKKSNLLIKATQSKQASQNIADENIEKIKKIESLLSKYELFVRQQNDLYNITEPEKIDGVKEQLTRIEGYFNDFDIEDIKKSKKIIEEIDLTKNDFIEYSEKEINDKKETELIDQIKKEFGQMSEELDIYTKQEINKPIINYNVFNQVKDLKSIPGYDAIQQNSINEKQDISYLNVDPTIAVFQKLNFLNGEDRKKIYKVKNTQTEHKGEQIIKNIEQFLEKNLGVSKKAEEIQINTDFPIDSVKIQDKNVFKSLNVEKEPFIQQGKMRNQMYYPKSTDESFLSVSKLFFEIEKKVSKTTKKITKTIDLEELQTGGNPITVKNILDELKINSQTNNIKFLGIEAKITQKTTIPGETIYKDFKMGKNEFDKFFSQGNKVFTKSEKKKVFGIYKSAFFEEAKIDIKTFLNTKNATKKYSVGVREFISSVTNGIEDTSKINEFTNRVYNFFGKIEKTSDVESYYKTENILFKNTDVELNIEWPTTSIEEISRPSESSLNAKFEWLRMHNIFHFEQQTVKKQMTQFDIETTSGKIVEIGFYTKDINNENGFKISIFNSNVDDLELKQIKAFKELGQYTKIHDLIKQLKTKNTNQQNQIIKKVYQKEGHITYLQDLNSDDFFNNILDDLRKKHSIDLNKSEQFIGYNTESFDIPLLQGRIKDNVFKGIFLNEDKNQDIYGNGLIRHELAQREIFLESYKQENVQKALGIDVSSAHIGQHDAETTYKIADKLNLVTKGQPNAFENLINYFREKFESVVYDGTRTLTGNETKTIVVDNKNSIYYTNKQIKDGFKSTEPELASFQPMSDVNSVIMFDGEDFREFNITKNKINVYQKDSNFDDFDFKIETNYSPKSTSDKISYEQIQNGIVAYQAEEKRKSKSGDNVLISKWLRGLLIKMKLNANKPKTYTQNMFNVSLIKELQITKDVNFVYKDIKGESDDTDIITKNFPLRSTINAFYTDFEKEFEKNFETQLNSTTKIKDFSDMKTSFIFDKTFDDLLENTKKLAPIWANRTEEEYKEYIKDLKAYFKSYYNLIQGAKDTLTLEPTDLMLKYGQRFKSKKSEINKFYNAFEKELKKELKNSDVTKIKDLSIIKRSSIFNKVFNRLLKNTKQLEPIWTNRKEQKYAKYIKGLKKGAKDEYIKDLKRGIISYYNSIQGAKDVLTLKPTDIMLKYEQYFESRESEINEFYNVFEKELEEQLSFAKEENIRISKNMGIKNPTGDIGEDKISLIFDAAFTKTLKEKKDFKKNINSYGIKIENLRKGFKAYYKGRFVTGRGLTDSPADYVVDDEKLEITENNEKVFDVSEIMTENQFGFEDNERTESVTKKIEIDYKVLVDKYIKAVYRNDHKNEYLKTLELFKNNFQNKQKTDFEEELFNLIESTERILKPFLEELYENQHINDYNNLKVIQEQTIRIQLDFFDNQKKFKKSEFSDLFYEALNLQIELNKKPEQSIYKINFANIDVIGLNKRSKLLGFINYVLTTTDKLQYKEGTLKEDIDNSTEILENIKTNKIKSIGDYNNLKNIILKIDSSKHGYGKYWFTASDFNNLPSFFILDSLLNLTSNKTITKQSLEKISALQEIYNFFENANENENNNEEFEGLCKQLSGNNSISALGTKLITELNNEYTNKTFSVENAFKRTLGNAFKRTPENTFKRALENIFKKTPENIDYITDLVFFNYLTEKGFDLDKIVHLDKDAYIKGEEESQETLSDIIYDKCANDNPEDIQLNKIQKEQEKTDRERFNFLIGKIKASVKGPYKKEDIEPLKEDVKNIITAKIDNIMQEMVLQKQNTPQSKPIVKDTNIQKNQVKQKQKVVNTTQNLPAQSNSNIKNQIVSAQKQEQIVVLIADPTNPIKNSIIGRYTVDPQKSNIYLPHVLATTEYILKFDNKILEPFPEAIKIMDELDQIYFKREEGEESIDSIVQIYAKTRPMIVKGLEDYFASSKGEKWKITDRSKTVHTVYKDTENQIDYIAKMFNEVKSVLEKHVPGMKFGIIIEGTFSKLDSIYKLCYNLPQNTSHNKGEFTFTTSFGRGIELKSKPINYNIPISTNTTQPIQQNTPESKPRVQDINIQQNQVDQKQKVDQTVDNLSQSKPIVQDINIQQNQGKQNQEVVNTIQNPPVQSNSNIKKLEGWPQYQGKDSMYARLEIKGDVYLQNIFQSDYYEDSKDDFLSIKNLAKQLNGFMNSTKELKEKQKIQNIPVVSIRTKYEFNKRIKRKLDSFKKIRKELKEKYKIWDTPLVVSIQTNSNASISTDTTQQIQQNTPQGKPIVQDTNIQQNQGKQNQEVVNTTQNIPAQSNSNIKNQSKNTNSNASISTDTTQQIVTSVKQTSKSLSKQNKTQGKETIKQFSEFKSTGIYAQLTYFTKLYFAEDLMFLNNNGFNNSFFQNLTDARKTDINSFLDAFIELSELKKVMNNIESKLSESKQKSQSSNTNVIYFISKNTNALKTDAYRMFDYIKNGKIKTQDAFGNDINKELTYLIYEYSDILKRNNYNPSKLYDSEKKHMNENIKLFVEQLVNKKFDESGGKVLGQGKKQINQNQFYKQLEFMKKIYDTTSLFFNKPKWKNMDALSYFSNETDAIIKEEIFNSYFYLGSQIQERAKMNKSEHQQLYIKLFEYFVDKNKLNEVNLKDKKELFNVIDLSNKIKKLIEQQNTSENILMDIYNREKTSYILLDNKKYYIKTDFKRVRITDEKEKEQIFDINNPIEIKGKEYKVGIKNGFISFIMQSGNEEIIPEYDYGKITIGEKVYTIVEGEKSIRYIVDEKGEKRLFQSGSENGAIIKTLEWSDQMQTNRLNKKYKKNFYKKQLYDFQEMYEQPKQKNFMMSFLYSYLQIKKNNNEQFNIAMENKDSINKIINKILGTNDRDYIQETELFINKFKENNKILFDGIEYTIFDQEESAIDILKGKYNDNINDLFYYKVKLNPKNRIIINSLELQNDLQIKVNMSVINKFKDENILGNETKLKKHIKDLIDNINKAKDEKEKQNFIAELNEVFSEKSLIDTSPLKNIVNKLQIINEDSNKLKKFTDLKDNQYLEQLFAFKDIEKSFYIKGKSGKGMHLYNIRIQLLNKSSRNANNNNINLLVERIEKKFEVEHETAVYAADFILNGSMTDRIFKQIIDKIKVDEDGNANEIEFEEKIVTRLEDINQEIKDSVEKTKVSAEEIIEKDKEIFSEQASKTNFKIKKYQIFGAIQAGVQQTIGIGINQKIKQEQKQQSLYQTNTALKYNPSIDQELEEPNFGMTLFSDDYANNIITSVISGHGSDFIQDNIVVNLYNKRITRINNTTN